MTVTVTVCVCRTAGAHITVNGKECLNLATLNFLGLLENESVKVLTPPHTRPPTDTHTPPHCRRLLLEASVSME